LLDSIDEFHGVMVMADAQQYHWNNDYALQLDVFVMYSDFVRTDEVIGFHRDQKLDRGFCVAACAGEQSFFDSYSSSLHSILLISISLPKGNSP
jgi:hypothetical protein